MVERSRRRFLAIVGPLAAYSACFAPGPLEHEGPSRVIDKACAADHCPMKGAAKRTSGITANAIGLRLGPGEGEVTIPLDKFFPVAGDNTWRYEVLVAGDGAFEFAYCATVCGPWSSATAHAEYAWVSLGGDAADASADPIYDPGDTDYGSAFDTGACTGFGCPDTGVVDTGTVTDTGWCPFGCTEPDTGTYDGHSHQPALRLRVAPSASGDHVDIADVRLVSRYVGGCSVARVGKAF